MSFFSVILNKIPRPVLIKLSVYLRPFADLWYRGKLFTDPINGKSYRKFLDYGYKNLRKNALSPGTLSLERHRLLWLYLKDQEWIWTKKDLKVMHLAPEQCFYKQFRKTKNWSYTTVDLYSPLADIKADICDLPFEDNSFDLILCNHVLEHIPDDRQALKELYRVMKAGGLAVLQVPLDYEREITFEDDSITDREKRTEIFGQYDHVRVYGMDYFKRISEVGFQSEALDFQKNMPSELIKKYALSPGELIPICKKI